MINLIHGNLRSFIFLVQRTRKIKMLHKLPLVKFIVNCIHNHTISSVSRIWVQAFAEWSCAVVILITSLYYTTVWWSFLRLQKLNTDLHQKNIIAKKIKLLITRNNLPLPSALWTLTHQLSVNSRELTYLFEEVNSLK